MKVEEMKVGEMKVGEMKDGDKIAQYMREASNKANSISRTVVFAIIATAWSISINDGTFVPNNLVKWALILSIVFVVLDILYKVISSLFYRYILNKYFKSCKDNGHEYKTNDNTYNIRVNTLTSLWQALGVWCFLVLQLLLITAGVLLIISIAT